ncbi:MAG: hypothetical protein H7644_05450 [Candidatus Heimdallarchaeota archaeon]|nr:hypothetical protein [Candidatus Heimdallarchaeota archaeon]MCK5143191.1 hypothetical protein [Candidatus Heimdallarchaeota archaeon]
MLNRRPVWFYKVERPIIHLWRILRIALPVFLYALGVVFGGALVAVRYL